MSTSCFHFFVFCSGYQLKHNQHDAPTLHRERCFRLPVPTVGATSVRVEAKDDLVLNHGTTIDRRKAVLSVASAVLFVPTIANSVPPKGDSLDPLERLKFGEGRWASMDRVSVPLGSPGIVPPLFCTYLTRFLIHNDPGVATWWKDLEYKCSLLPTTQQQSLLGEAFGSLARSLELALEPVVLNSSRTQESYEKLWDHLVGLYGDQVQQIAILFAILPFDHQPFSRLRTVVTSSMSYEDVLKSVELAYSRPESFRTGDLSNLLPPVYRSVRIEGSDSFTVYPAIPLFEVGINEDFGKTQIATPFGPLSSTPVIRELPTYSLNTYALLGICGAAGCALTHSVVIPIDVVKTRNQVNPGLYKNFLDSGLRIVKDEGLKGLLLGAQATLVGYFWYGLSVYPSYTLFKRALTLGVLPPEVATLHTNDIALVAGALAAVVASLGLTPLEAARIRVVANPEKYRPIGLIGTLLTIAREDEANPGWKALYAGLPSLLTRQVIFGSVKFLAFERACDLIYAVWPVLRDSTWTSLTVSLIAGGLSGALSSVVSQPADSVLTYVSQNSDGSTSKLGLIEGCIVMVQKEGMGSLFRGLNSRIIWAGSIIAGQFLLYDVFRTFFGVSPSDLSQVYLIQIPTS